MIHINSNLLETVSQKAKMTTRQRTNHNFHDTASDTLHRMLNAVEPNSYVCPHKHENPSKREAFIILQGSMLVVQFDLEGNITDHTILSTKNGNYGVEIPAGTYHTIAALEPSTVVYEIKDGPYDVSNDKGFAPWAPLEGSLDCQQYLTSLFEKLGIKFFYK